MVGPMTEPATATPAATNHQSPLARILRRLGTDSSYVLVGFPLVLVSFVVVVTGFSFGAGLLITVVGLPVLTVTIHIARVFADLERRRAAGVLGWRPPRPRYRTAEPDAGWLRRTVVPLADPQSWLDLVYPVVALPVTITTWSFALTWWSCVVAALGNAAFDWALPHSKDNIELHELLGYPDTPDVRIVFYTLVGLFFLLTLVPVMRGCALLQAHLTRTLLTGVAELQAMINGLQQQKADADARTATAQARTAAAVSAEATALRRLERDIHDGPQQRLVRLSMDLGRARHQLDTDDAAAARTTVTEAITQARETLDELRAFSRGIAPPILVDRGLAAAVTALAGRCTVPVDLETTDLPRLDTGVESTAYFVVAEALTNVAKHSRATECQISLRRTDEAILVRISDNGTGGAHLAKGHGLAGLADRVSAAGGRLTIDSPPDTGTVVTAELPL